MTYPLHIAYFCSYLILFLYINVCCFISNFHPVAVVNFNYVSSSKFVLSQKVLLMFAARVSKFRNF